MAARRASRPARCRSGLRRRRAAAPGRPGARSAIPVANPIERVAVARRKAVSSTPTRASTGPRPAPSRVGSSISGVPRSITWSITVHQADPELGGHGRDRGVLLADLLERPPAGPARSARPAARLPGAARSSVFTSHRGCGQHQTRFHQHSTTGRPPMGRSRTQLGAGPSAAPPPRTPGTDQVAMVSISNSSSPPTSTVVSTLSRCHSVRPGGGRSATTRPTPRGFSSSRGCAVTAAVSAMGLAV